MMTSIDETRSGHIPTGRLHLGVNLVGPAAEMNFQQLRTLAQTAERGVFSFLTLDERYWLREDPGAAAFQDPTGSNDVATLLAALAAVTTRIGMVAAAAPDYDDPANLLHRIASLEKLSGRRAAWNMLPDGATDGTLGTTGDDEGVASAEGRQGLIESAQRLWAESANLVSAGAGGPSGTARADSVRTVGKFERDGQQYTVGLGAPRPRKMLRGPVLIHAGDTAAERDFAARYADVITTGPADIREALALRRDMTARTFKSGRAANDVKIFQAATFILAPTEIQAIARADWMRAQLPEGAWDEQAFIGSYTGVAELLQDFVRAGAVDGFTIMPWLFPDELSELVNHLIPEMQRLGIYPRGYAAHTLRGNLGLADACPWQDQENADTPPVIEVDDLGDVHLDLRMELIVQKRLN